MKKRKEMVRVFFFYFRFMSSSIVAIITATIIAIPMPTIVQVWSIGSLAGGAVGAAVGAGPTYMAVDAPELP